MNATPTREELRQAFQSGFDSIDAGDTFSQGFVGCLESLGYRKRADERCTCADEERTVTYPNADG